MGLGLPAAVCCTPAPVRALTSAPTVLPFQGLDEVALGLSNLGAQLSLGFRQVAHTVGQYLPPELNPFVEEYEYEEEEGGPQDEVALAAAQVGRGVRAAPCLW